MQAEGVSQVANLLGILKPAGTVSKEHLFGAGIVRHLPYRSPESGASDGIDLELRFFSVGSVPVTDGSDRGPKCQVGIDGLVHVHGHPHSWGGDQEFDVIGFVGGDDDGFANW